MQNAKRVDSIIDRREGFTRRGTFILAATMSTFTINLERVHRYENLQYRVSL
jgi:hypothetical protein